MNSIKRGNSNMNRRYLKRTINRILITIDNEDIWRELFCIMADILFYGRDDSNINEEDIWRNLFCIKEDILFYVRDIIPDILYQHYKKHDTKMIQENLQWR